MKRKMTFAVGAAMLFAADVFAGMSVAVSDDDLFVSVEAGDLDDTSALYLVWDTADHGEDLADWPAANRIAYSGSPTVSSSAATYTLDKSSVPEGAYLRVIATSDVRLIGGYIAFGVTNQYINTGIVDTSAYGLEICYRATKLTGIDVKKYTPLTGSIYNHFTIGDYNGNIDKFYIRYRGVQVASPAYQVTDKADPLTVRISDGKLYVDSTQVTKSPSNADLASMSGSVGTSGKEILIGAAWDATNNEAIMCRWCLAEWYYATLLDDSGNALVNLLPALRGDTASPEAVFYDTVSGKCFAKSGTNTALTYSGSTTNTVVVTAAASASLYNGVRTAVWTGAGDPTDATDPLNWTISEMGQSGTGVPKDGTKISDCTLAADADWSAIAQTNCEITGIIELAGHNLTVGCLAGTGTITDSTGGGELHVSVGSGLSVTNDGIALTGSLKLVKEGAGTLVGAKSGQTYTGGTLVSGGILVRGVASQPFGAQKALVTVEDGAAFDWAGGFDKTSTAYDFAIEGVGPDGDGAMVSTVSSSTWNTGAIADLVLNGDALIGGYGGWGFNYYGSTADVTHTITMNGHTLNIKIRGTGNTKNNSGTFHFRNVTTVGEGTIAIVDCGSTSAWVYPTFFGHSSDLSSVVFDLGEGYCINLGESATVGTFIDRRSYGSRDFDLDDTARARAVTVLDSFKPMTTNLVRTIVLGDATHLLPVLDLSALDGPFVVPSANYSIGMASGATVQVRLGDRKNTSKVPIITWPGERPEWVDSLRFVNGDSGRRYSIAVKDNGIYAVRGLIISVF